MILPGKRVFLPVLSLGIASCAYFNTFYNAQQYFRDAEREIHKADEGVPPNQKALDALEKTVQKSTRVVEEYPGSRWWDDALLLRGKAHYHRGEYALAEASFERLIAEAMGSSLVPEARLWALRCQWKLGYPEIALAGLKEVLDEEGKSRLSRRDRAAGHEWMAELYLEEDQVDSAVHHYVRSSRYLRDARERSRIYLKIADLAYRRSRFSQALEYYGKVIRVADQPGPLERAHLQVVKIARMQGQWDEATRQIQALLSEKKLTGIQPELHLELARLYEVQDRKKEAMDRYRRITEEFPRTDASAEAYFRLGMLTVETWGDYENSRTFFSRVEKENRFSEFVDPARAKVKEIDAVLSVLGALKAMEESQLPSESSETVPDTVNLPESYADNLYAYGELLAFHFDQPDSGIRVFEDLVNRFPGAAQRPRALYALTHLYREKGDDERARVFARKLMTEYPTTEFAAEASLMVGMAIPDDVPGRLQKAEDLLPADPVGAINLYRDIVENSPNSRYVPVAVMAIARTYDVRLNDPDNSLVWYGKLIQDFPESDQARAVRDRYEELLQLSRPPEGDEPEPPVPPGQGGNRDGRIPGFEGERP